MTRRISVLAAAISFVGGTLAFAQVTGVKAKDPALQAAIEARQKAVDTKNAAEWTKYSADDFVQVTAQGTVNSRADRLKTLATNTNKPSSVVIDRITMFGPDAAVMIQHTPSAKAQNTFFWIRQGGAWKVAAAAGSPYAGK